MFQSLAFRNGSHGNVRRGRNLLREPELRLARKSVWHEATSYPAVQLGTRARDVGATYLGEFPLLRNIAKGIPSGSTATAISSPSGSVCGGITMCAPNCSAFAA